MPKPTTQFLCSKCGDTFPKWLGKCPSCGEWNTINKFHESKTVDEKKGNITEGVDLFNTSTETSSLSTSITENRISTNISEVDRVLGNGFFLGSFILFGGSPGVGKSTLSLQIFMNINNAFYFSGEESRDQVLSRKKRIIPNPESNKDVAAPDRAPLHQSLHHSQPEKTIFSTNSLEDICETVIKNKPRFVIIDSIQMISREGVGMGQITQIRENAEVLLKLAKSTGTTVCVIGHITKSDEIAGPKILEHLVDVVLYLEGDRGSELRILRSTKNRFGSTQEVGVFEMTNGGLMELKNPSKFFLAERADNAAGSAITVVREGARNFLMEIQALTVKTNFGLPRRTSHGIDLSKLHLLLAVISKFTPFKCDQSDAYLNVVGGLKIKEPASDLAVCAAILSSCTQKEISTDMVIMGEVGLSGEVRHVTALETRLRETEKLGFKKAIVPRIPKGLTPPKHLKIMEVRSIGELMQELFGK